MSDSNMLWSYDDCKDCRGTGKIWDRHETQDPCPDCMGTGHNFTSLGKELIEFLETFFVISRRGGNS